MKNSLLRRFNSLSVRLTIGYSCLMLLMCGVLAISLYNQLRNIQYQGLRERLEDIVRFAGPQVDGDFHALVSDAEDENTSFYREIVSRMQAVQETSDIINHIYTIRIQPDGTAVYVIDLGEDQTTHHVGDAYERAAFVSQALLDAGGPVVDPEVQTDVSGIYLTGYVPITDQFKQVTGYLGVEIDASAMQEGERRILQTVGIVFLITVVLSSIVGWYLTSRLTSPIKDLVAGTERVAQGQLGQPVPVRGQDELGKLAQAFNNMMVDLQQVYSRLEERITNEQTAVQEYAVYLAQVASGNLSIRLATNGIEKNAGDPLVALRNNLNEMTTSLERLILQIRDASARLNAAAQEILSATTQQASGASEQSAAITQTTATVDEVRIIAEQSSGRAETVTDTAQHSVLIAQSGQQAVQETIEGMNQIKERVEGIAQNIQALSLQTQQIAAINATVNDIAARSNMLALNASVEAARAGENGRGFAVVASEIRNLAEQSRLATVQVKVILNDIQKATNAAVMATEEGTQGVERGVHLATQAGQAIGQLTKAINESSQSAQQMAGGSRQQVKGVEQVSLAMQNISQLAVQSLASTRQTEQTAQELNELAGQLFKIVAQYRAAQKN